MAIFDNDMNYLMVSDRWRIEFKLGDQDIIGKSHYEVFGDIPQQSKDIHQDCLAGATHIDDRVEYPRANGSIDYVKREIRPWYTDDNKIGGIIIFADVITDFINTQEALNQQLQIQEMMIEHLPDFSVVLFDHDMRILLIGGDTLRKNGRDINAIQGKTLKEVVSEDIYEILEPQYQRTLDGESFFFERRPEHVHGQVLHSFANPIRNDQGEVIAGLMVTQDVSNLDKVQQSLNISEARFEAIFDNTFQFIGFMNKDGIILEVNKAALDFAGIREEDAIGKPFWDSVWWSGSTEIQAIIKSAVQYASTGEFIRFEIQVENKHNKITYLDFSIKPIFDAKGQVVQLIPEGRDITDMVQIREALTKSNADLQNFAYVASHDLQEPLRMVTSFLDLLRQEYKNELSEEADEYIDYAIDGAQRMKSLIQDLLAYSRITTQGDSFTKVDLNDVLQSVESSLSVVLAEEQAKINLKTPLPTVSGDVGQLNRVFQNLISNAIKFKRVDHIPTIDIDCQRAKNHWQIAVKDNGIGIDSKFYDRVFVIFQRLHRREDYPGTGIGLSICKKVIERHNGNMWIESVIGQGTTFYFTIPILERDS